MTPTFEHSSSLLTVKANSLSYCSKVNSFGISRVKIYLPQTPLIQQLMDGQSQNQADGGANLPIQPAIQPPVQAIAQPQVQQNAVNRINVRVPPFWKQDPQLWFRQLEAQFATSNIVNDLTKFNTIVGVIESDILSAVSDIVLNPPANHLYRTIKQRLINEFADSDTKKLKCLLNDLSLGDMKPSSLLRKMRELSCGKVGDDLLKTLWLQRLTESMQTVLSTRDEALDDLVVLADNMFDITEASSVRAVSTAQNSQFNDLVNVVCKLEGKIESLKQSFHEPKESYRRKSRHRSPTPSKASSVTGNNLCFYHKQFGKKAIKCKQPCDFIISKPKNFQASQASRSSTKARK